MNESVLLKFSFVSGHRYWNSNLSPSDNEKNFGKCITPHGHNYELEVTLSSPDITASRLEIWRHLLAVEAERLDHRFLTESIPFFVNQVPTTENIARYFRENFKEKNLPVTHIRVFENTNLWSEI